MARQLQINFERPEIMPRLSHTSPPLELTVRELIARHARRLRRAGVFFGHGTDNADDDAAALVWHALALPPRPSAKIYARRVKPVEFKRVEALMRRRIAERIPAVYLTGQTWFAGLPFYVDPRVLIPRSPIAELIEHRFAPWIDAGPRPKHPRYRHRLGLHRHRLREGVSANRASRCGGHLRRRARSRRAATCAGIVSASACGC